MLHTDIVRLAALSSICQTLESVRDLPWQYDPRIGVLRINDEPIVIPRDWLQRDPYQDWIDSHLRSAWRAATELPFRIDASSYQRGIVAWNREFHISANIDTGMVITASVNTPHSDAAPEIPWQEFPDTTATLPELLRSIIRDDLEASTEMLDTEYRIDECLVDDLVTTLMHEISCRIDGTHLRDCLMMLSAGDDEVLERIFPMLPHESALRARFVWIAEAKLQADTWTGADRHLAPFVPFAVSAGCAPTPAGTAAWLRANGLSRKGLLRLRYLPVSTLDAVVFEWAWHTSPDWSGCVAWLNTLLTEMHRFREREIDARLLLSTARIAAVAGVMKTTEADRKQAGGLHSVYCTYAPRDEGYDGIETAIGGIIDYLCRTRTDTAEAFSLTMIREFLGGSAETVGSIRAHIGDVRDWICGVENYGGGPTNLTPDDVGPNWQALMRHQHRWHEEYRALLARFPRYPRAERHDYVSSTDKPVAWQPLCEAFTLGDYRVVPFASSTDLWEEGLAMQHCVATYTNLCASGRSQVFSVRGVNDDSRIGTVEFGPDRSAWRLVQFRGMRNKELLTNTGVAIEPYTAVITELARRLNDGIARVARAA